ncbi:uncharacterized protein LOC116961817 [Tyto alba]|uniref:uncharacterized protein LOC116961817 n=1 Tax=Tyto alba TaxID=56313 RepID=UPI001C67F74A|nr:uncharacterized protein LOC116961817 [Tyto alba]
MLCPGLTSARWVGVGESLAAAAASASSSPAATVSEGWVCGAVPSHSARPPPPALRRRARSLGAEGTRELLPPRPPASPRQPLGEAAARLRRRRQQQQQQRGAAPPRGRRWGERPPPLPVPAKRVPGPPQCAVAHLLLLFLLDGTRCHHPAPKSPSLKSCKPQWQRILVESPRRCIFPLSVKMHKRLLPKTVLKKVSKVVSGLCHK